MRLQIFGMLCGFIIRSMGLRLKDNFDPGYFADEYGSMANGGTQENMLRDSIRVSSFHRAISGNPTDFQGRSVMDVGAGTGLLSFFAARAGAARVYSVEVSNMARVEHAIAVSNSFPNTTITVVNQAVEYIGDEIRGKVDVLVSEPFGEFLFHERMVETYLVARDRFLRPGGKMFPNVCVLNVAPFSDASMHAQYQYLQQGSSGLADPEDSFWNNSSFYGINLTAAIPFIPGVNQQRRVILDRVHPAGLLAAATTLRFDLETIGVKSLQHIEIPFDFDVQKSGLVHGVVGWFDALFAGSDATVVLSTAPWCPLTHWWQSHLLMKEPLPVQAGDHIQGELTMDVDDPHMSYDMRVTMRVAGTSLVSGPQGFDLDEWVFRPNDDDTSNWAMFYSETTPQDQRCHTGELLPPDWGGT